jgi:hypothetical protein
MLTALLLAGMPVQAAQSAELNARPAYGKRHLPHKRVLPAYTECRTGWWRIHTRSGIFRPHWETRCALSVASR